MPLCPATYMYVRPKPCSAVPRPKKSAGPPKARGPWHLPKVPPPLNPPLAMVFNDVSNAINVACHVIEKQLVKLADRWKAQLEMPKQNQIIILVPKKLKYCLLWRLEHAAENFSFSRQLPFNKEPKYACVSSHITIKNCVATGAV